MIETGVCGGYEEGERGQTRSATGGCAVHAWLVSAVLDEIIRSSTSSKTTQGDVASGYSKTCRDNEIVC